MIRDDLYLFDNINALNSPYLVMASAGSMVAMINHTRRVNYEFWHVRYTVALGALNVGLLLRLIAPGSISYSWSFVMGLQMFFGQVHGHFQQEALERRRTPLATLYEENLQGHEEEISRDMLIASAAILLVSSGIPFLSIRLAGTLSSCLGYAVVTYLLQFNRDSVVLALPRYHRLRLTPQLADRTVRLRMTAAYGYYISLFASCMLGYHILFDRSTPTPRWLDFVTFTQGLSSVHYFRLQAASYRVDKSIPLQLARSGMVLSFVAASLWLTPLARTRVLLSFLYLCNSLIGYVFSSTQVRTDPLGQRELQQVDAFAVTILIGALTLFFQLNLRDHGPVPVQFTLWGFSKYALLEKLTAIIHSFGYGVLKHDPSVQENGFLPPPAAIVAAVQRKLTGLYRHYAAPWRTVV